MAKQRKTRSVSENTSLDHKVRFPEVKARPKAKKKEPKTYTEAIEVVAKFIDLRGLGEHDIWIMVYAISLIYGKTEEGVRTSITVKRLQIEVLKGLDHE